MLPDGTLILAREEISRLMNMADYIHAMENAFRLHAEGKTITAGILDIMGQGGAFHIKAAGMTLADEIFVAVKVNGNFPENFGRYGLPTIQGAIILSDAENGYPVAILDSTEITANRTAAASAVAAKRLARPNSRVATVCGCGKQGKIQLTALSEVLPLEKVFAYDVNPKAIESFLEEWRKNGRLELVPVESLANATNQSDIIVTCTTSRRYFLRKEDVSPGTFIAAVGADSHDKQELDPGLFVSNKVVVDILEQCAKIGDLHHAIEAGLATKANVYSELAPIVAGQVRGRTCDEEITIFDSTGTAIQDVAAAAVVYRKARDQTAGLLCNLTGAA